MNRTATEIDLYRNTGRTTGRMLLAIGQALEKHGEWVPFYDHCGDVETWINDGLHITLDMLACSTLGLFMDVDVHLDPAKGKQIVIRSAVERLKELREQAAKNRSDRP